ncbi:unnamed protein product [Rangifer tarandus platyrhynchus]|uniref:Uncharacterized protein n=1 Tax=Rangifer tarandus platyrhynchus TaxID=3082113 RepID=A0ABN8Z0N7_RANTA|nr:unnamed protein product [Rangifer tarandus platyrhynchus]
MLAQKGSLHTFQKSGIIQVGWAWLRPLDCQVNWVARVFPVAQMGKESACNAGDPGSIPGSGRSSGEGNGSPLQYSGLENPHGQRSLAGYSSWRFAKSRTRLSD